MELRLSNFNSRATFDFCVQPHCTQSDRQFAQNTKPDRGKPRQGQTCETTAKDGDFQAKWLQEFLDSGISEEVARQNAFWLEGEAATIELLQDTIASRQRVREYITAPNAALMRRYQFMEAGAWFARPALPSAPYAKPKKPRASRDKAEKVVKYETPPGAEAAPLFPHLGTAVEKRWGISTWAEVLLRSDIPIFVAEGWKKALALISQGFLAICIRGVTQWHQKGEKALHPDLAPYAKGREFVVVFDQDEKVTTKANVSQQAKFLGMAIERSGGKPKFLVWDGAQGKGIDDVLASLAVGDRADWIEMQLAIALTPQQYRRIETIAKSWSIVGAPPPTPARHTTGPFMPPLPAIEPGINWIAATVGSGKTHRIGKDWVGPWIEDGGIVVALSPLNALGQQTAKEWGLPHIHDYRTDRWSQKALEADVRYRGGLCACPNSAHRILEIIPKDRPLMVVVDEAVQVLGDAAEGGTLQSRWGDRWKDVGTLMKSATSIVLSQDGLDRKTISVAQNLCVTIEERIAGAMGQAKRRKELLGDRYGKVRNEWDPRSDVGSVPTVGYSHTKEVTPRSCKLYRATPISDFRAQLLDKLKAGDKILFVTTSQSGGQQLEAILKERMPSLKVRRVDSITTEGGRYRGFFEDPDRWLQEEKPDLLILSPSAKTGISIEGGVSVENAYFNSIWGYFPSLDSDTHKQMLFRYRPDVPMFIWCPAFITPSYGETPNPWHSIRLMEQEAAQYAKYGNFEQSPADPHDEAVKHYLAARRQRRWAQKMQPAEILAHMLVKDGHRVEFVSDGISKNEEVHQLWEDIKEQIAREDSQFHANLELEEHHTIEWAHELDHSVSTYHQRCTAFKIKMIHKFPGLDWNDPELWYEAVFCPRHSATTDRPSRAPLAKGAALWAEADFYQDLFLQDAKEAEHILKQQFKAIHLLPKAAPRAALASLFTPDLELLLKAGKVTPDGEAEQRIKQTALKYALEINQYWGLNIAEYQSVTAIVNKIAHKLGLVTQRKGKVTTKGGRLWVYTLTVTEKWGQLVEARRTALAGTSSLRSLPIKDLSPPIDPIPPPDRSKPIDPPRSAPTSPPDRQK